MLVKNLSTAFNSCIKNKSGIRNKTNSYHKDKIYNPVGKIAEKAVCRSVFLKAHSFRLFFGDVVTTGIIEFF